jgi:hypothetical protein
LNHQEPAKCEHEGEAPGVVSTWPRHSLNSGVTAAKPLVAEIGPGAKVAIVEPGTELLPDVLVAANLNRVVLAATFSGRTDAEIDLGVGLTVHPEEAARRLGLSCLDDYGWIRLSVAMALNTVVLERPCKPASEDGDSYKGGKGMPERYRPVNNRHDISVRRGRS